MSNPKGHKITWGSGGDVTGAANVGTGAGQVFRDEVAGTLNLKTIKAGANITVTNNADDITIAGNAGDVTGAANVGAGSGIFRDEVAGVLNLKSLIGGDGITLAAGADDITINVDTFKVQKYYSAVNFVPIPAYNDGLKNWVPAPVDRYTFPNHAFSTYAAKFIQGVNSAIAFSDAIPENAINDAILFGASARTFLYSDNVNVADPSIHSVFMRIVEDGSDIDAAKGGFHENILFPGQYKIKYASGPGSYAGTFARGNFLEMWVGRELAHAGLSNDTHPGNIYLMGVYMEYLYRVL